MDIETNQENKGYIVLISVILLSVIGVTIATSLLLLGLGNSQSSFVFEQSTKAAALAESCTETALNSLRQDPGFPGGQTFTFDFGSCNVLPIEFNGPSYIIKTEAQVNDVYKRTTVSAQRLTDPIEKMQIDSWLEVGDF